MGYSFIERPEARYKIIYGRHDKITPASELPSQFDGLFLEGGDWWYSRSEIGDGHRFQNYKQYSEIVEKTQERNAKIYFGDVPLRKFPLSIKIGERNFFPDWPTAIRTTEFFIGPALALSLAIEIDQKKNISRRDFLKRIGKGAAVVWSTSWLSKFGTIFFKEGQEVSTILERMISVEDLIHPEDLSLWLRNAILAQKLITIGKREQAKHNRKAEMVTVFGGSHTGIAEFLRRGKEACERIVKLYPKWFLKAMISEGNLDYISLVIGAKYSPQYNLWVITDRFHDEGLYFSVNREQEFSNTRKEIR